MAVRGHARVRGRGGADAARLRRRDRVVVDGARLRQHRVRHERAAAARGGRCGGALQGRPEGAGEAARPDRDVHREVGHDAVGLLRPPPPVAAEGRPQRVRRRRDGHAVGDRAALPRRADRVLARAVRVLHAERQLVPPAEPGAVGADERQLGLRQPAGGGAGDHDRPGRVPVRVPPAGRRPQPVPVDRGLHRLRPARRSRTGSSRPSRRSGRPSPTSRSRRFPRHAGGGGRRTRQLEAGARVVRRPLHRPLRRLAAGGGGHRARPPRRPGAGRTRSRATSRSPDDRPDRQGRCS